MKRLSIDRTMLFIMASIATAVLFMFGDKSTYTEMIIASGAPVIALSEADRAELNETELKMVSAVEKLAGQIYEKVEKRAVTKEEVTAMLSGVKDSLRNDELKKLNDAFENIKQAAEKQGTTLSQIESKLASSSARGFKAISEVLQESKEELKRVYEQGSGTAKFMVMVNNKGEFVMSPVEKAAGPHATIDAVGSGGNTSSVTHNLSTASILRLAGSDANIVSQFRNTPFIFDLVNTTTAGFDIPFAIWFEEQARQGNPAVVAEGGTKPTVQYAYQLKSAEYRKAAALIGITQEFNLDFGRLENDIMGKGRADVIQLVNDDVLTRIQSAATSYSTGASFGAVTDANEFDCIAAMAAQVDNATKGGATANAALMSTFKKYKMGVAKSDNKGYLNPPSILSSIAFIGNSAMGSDEVIVGAMNMYNIILRGGFIVKIGYNGTDFAENRFSVVMEQFYYDYISDIHKAAIVKGPDFTTVKSAIGA